ncbi:GNAT family N-acetyltransferase [Paenibacillus wynnii]|uniref:GNAT family N-acetyltransferase n=1 Tax=Paenibacillus wynnii TaxID=268407 RepID=UPI0027943482|nr:GNAT family N-acetyltransferase [Paenibacillus wynnii]MDQ0195692.1 GNAT superfamily N-acetyltransferase [Paenibacillus wynnii]
MSEGEVKLLPTMRNKRGKEERDMLYKSIEEITLNTWPAEQSILLQGWILRSAAGYTKRANSVNPLYGAGASDDEVRKKIKLAEAYYLDAGLKPVFKITPYIQPADLDKILEGFGYSVVEPSSVRVLDLNKLPVANSQYSVQIQNEWSEEWLEAFAELTELSDENRRTLKRMFSASTLKQGYALLLKEGVPTACGLGVIQHGYMGIYDIVTSTSHRRQGMGEQLLMGLLHWGKQQGASSSFLQVVLANHGACALYDKLGFEEIYQYWYRVRN